MEYSLKQLVDLANGLLKEADVGREYTIEYVVKRLDDAMDEYPSDPVIRSMAQVISKQAKNGKLTTSQKELYNVYNHFAGISSTSMIKEAIGDILYPTDNAPKATVGSETAYTYRSNSPDLNFKVENNPLENIFDKNINASSYYDPTLAKLGKGALINELNNIGVPATDIKVVAGVGNNAAIVYDAIFTNKLGTTHVPMFVEVLNGVQPPTHFYAGNEFVQLTAENLNKHIVYKAQEEKSIDIGNIGGVKTSSSVLNPSFSFEKTPEEIKINRVAIPGPLKDLVAFEDALINSGTGFTNECVKTAQALCVRELNNMGFKAQVRLADSTNDCIICSAELDSSVGKVEIRLPVEIVNEKPQIPALFYNELSKDKIYDFSKSELSNYLTAIKLEDDRILRYSNDYFNMSYNQLKEEVLTGAATKDYVRAEQAINRIEDKFGLEHHRMVMSDYAKYLARTSSDEVIPPAHKCRLLITKGSVEPRCGHYNVSLARVSTNENGDCELLDRKAKYDNLAESNGVMLRSNKIVLT